MELKYLKYNIEIKEINDDGEFLGVASAYGNIDYADEVVVKGAFDKHMNTTMFPMLWQHKTESPIGVIHVLGTDGDGLDIKGEINLEVQQGKEAHSLLKQKAIKGLSIGYTVEDDKWDKRIRYLTEIKLWEVSIVTFPCNELAQINQVKSFNTYNNVSMLDKPWNASEAEKRITEWASDKDGKIKWSQYRKAFLWYDKNDSDKKGSHKLPIADIVDGKLSIIKEAISSAVKEICEGKIDIPEEDVITVKSDISKYYGKMEKEDPFKSKTKSDKDVKDFNSVLQDRLMWRERWELFEVLEDIVIDLLYGQYDDKEVKNVVAESCDQFKVSLLDWVDRALNSDMYKSREENVNWKKEIISDLRDSGILKLPFSKISSSEDIKDKDKLSEIMNEMKNFRSEPEDSTDNGNSEEIIKDMKNFINERKVD